MRTIWFIRHAQSEANAGLPTTHTVTNKLSPVGQQQAIHLAQAFPKPPDLIITSPYIRTRLTAQPTLDRFPTVRHEEWAVQEFTCIAQPREKDTTATQRGPMHAEYWRRNDPNYIDGEDAECFANLLDRVRAMFEQIRQTECEFTAVFSHGQFLRAMLWMHFTTWTTLTPRLMSEFYQFDRSILMPNTGVTPAKFSEDGKLYLGKINVDHLPESLKTF